MRKLYLFSTALLFGCVAAADSPYQNITHQFWAAKTAFAGYSSWYLFVPKTAVPVTCSPTQSRCWGSGYHFQGGEGAHFFSEGEPPAGLYTIWGGSEAIYQICDVKGISFTLRQNDCSGNVATFTDSGTGRQAVLVNVGERTYFTDVTGFPAGTVFRWYSMDAGGILASLRTEGGIPWQYDSYNVALEAQIPANAKPGVYNASVTGARNGGGQHGSTASWSIAVLPAPKAPPQLSPASTPAIPGLSQWQTTMTSSNGGGLAWCSNPENPTETFYFGVESQVWYYDGARVYFQIADYTGDPKWRNCGHNIASQYADYIISNNGQSPGYRVFPHGLAMASLLYPSEAKFQQAFDLMLNSGTFTTFGGRIDDDLIRETAYAVNVFTVAESVLGYPRNDKLQRSAEFLMGMLLSYTDRTDRYSQNQTFYDGLAMEALIGYYQLTKDPRVPVVVKRTLDSIWANYDQIGHVIVYDPDPVGPHCAEGGLWWTDGGADCAFHNPAGKILHNLVTGAFAWYWSISGDDTYRVEGDELFQHTLDDVPYSGKEFSQAYRWSFYYVNTRTTGKGD